jgi:hypothetical protein
MSDYLRFLQWNCRGGLDWGKLLPVLALHKPDVLLLNETFCPSPSFTIPGYTVYRFDRRQSRRGGVIIAVRNGLTVLRVDVPPDQEEDWLAIDLAIAGALPIKIVTMYSRPASHVTLNINRLRALMAGGRTIFAGDVNAKHWALGSHGKATANGIALHLFLASPAGSSIVVLSDGTPTHIPDHGDSPPDQLDLWLATSDLLPKLSPVHVLNPAGSDHLPTSLTYGSAPLITVDLRYNFNRADWPLYRFTLTKKLAAIDFDLANISAASIDAFAEAIIAAIIAAADVAIPKCPFGELRSWFISVELRIAMRDRNERHRMSARFRLPTFRWLYNRANREVKRLVVLAKEEAFRRRCDGLEDLFHLNLPKFWANTNSLLGRPKKGAIRYPLTIRDTHGNVADSDIGKANLLAAHLRTTFAERDHPGHITASIHRANIEQAIAADPATFQPIFNLTAFDDLPEIMTVEADDVDRAAKTLPPKAPGIDGVVNVLLKNGGPALMYKLCILFRLSLTTGYVPSQWKMAVVIPIPKRGKDTTLVTGFRPISLLPTIGKLLDVIMVHRVAPLMETGDLLPETQSGSRRGRSTDDQLFRLSEEAAVATASGKTVVTAFLDVTAAFDSVWHAGLLWKLRHAGLPTALVRWFSGYLTGRQFCVRVNGQLSVCHPIAAGVPQGSSLSPLLYTFYTADILPLDPELRYADDGRFMDDIVLWAADVEPAVAEQAVQLDIDSIDDWCAAWRHELNPDKSFASSFSRKRQPYNPILRAAGRLIPVTTTPKYLGVTFQRQLFWTEHIKAKVADAARRLNGLKVIARKGLRFRATTIITVYKVLIRSVLEYGCLAWAAAPLHLWGRLQRLQNAALRIALRLPPWTPIAQLHRLADIERIKPRILMRCANYASAALSCKLLPGRLIAQHRGRMKSDYLQRKAPLAAFEEWVAHGPVRQRPPPA